MILLLSITWLTGCAGEKEPRAVSEETYPKEYADAMCAVQVRCGEMDDLGDCQSVVESSWVRKLASGCFDASAARECLDVLESVSCDGYLDGESSVCTDVDECT